MGSGAGVITLSYIIVSSSFLTCSSIASGTLRDDLMTRVTLSSSFILYATEVYELQTTDFFQAEIFNEYNNLFDRALAELPVKVSSPYISYYLHCFSWICRFSRCFGLC